MAKKIVVAGGNGFLGTAMSGYNARSGLTASRIANL